MASTAFFSFFTASTAFFVFLALAHSLSALLVIRFFVGLMFFLERHHLFSH